MIPRTNALCLGLSLLTVSGTSWGQDAEESVVAIYDLKPVSPGFDDDSEWVHSLVLPPADPYGREDYLKMGELHDAGESSDLVVDLVTQALGDELRREGRQVSAEGSSRLLVMAPERIQGQVRALLTLLEEALSSSSLLQIDVLTLADPWDEIGSAVVAEEEAQALIQGLEGRGAVHQEFSLRLFAGRTSALDLMRRTPFVYDYDLEIAQAATIYEPVLVDALAGTRLVLRGVPMPGGLGLSIVYQDADQLGEVIDRPLEVQASIAQEKDGVFYVPGPNVFQSVQVLSRSFAFDTFLPEGRAILFSSSTRLEGRASHQLVVLRQKEAGLRAFHRGSITGTPQELVLVNSELWSPPHLRFSGPSSLRDDPDYPYVRTRMRAEPSLFLFDWMKYRFSIWRRMGPWAIALTEPSMDGDAARRLDRFVSRWQPDVSLIDVDVTLTSGQVNEAPVRLRLPIRTGSKSGVLVGVSTNTLDHFSSNVANFSSAPDPEQRTAFSGVALGLQPSVTQDGMVSLALHGLASLQLGEIQSVQISDATIGHVERVDYDRLELDENVRFEGSDASHSLGDAARTASEPSLGLRLRVRRP